MLITDQLTKSFLLEVPAAVAVLRGPDFIFELVNEEYLKLVGKTESVLIGQEGRKALPELEDQGVWKIFDQVYDTGKPFEAKEFSANIDRNNDGNFVQGYYSFIAKPVKENGKTLGILIHAHEVSDHVISREAVEASEEQLQAFVNHIPVLAWVANPDGYIYWYNRAWYEYSGTTEDEMEGWGWKKVHSPAFIDSVMVRWQSSIDTGLPFEMTFPLLSAGGTYHNFLTRISPYYGPSGKLEKWFGTNTRID